MVALVQRVSQARVEVDGAVVGAIGPGLLVLLGVAQGDTEAEADWLAQKTACLRVFPDAEGRMNRSLLDTGGEALVVSQFTLLGDLRKGTRPSYSHAAPPEEADRLYRYFAARLAEAIGKPVPTGVFGAMMQVHLVNDGPVTLWVEREPKSRRAEDSMSGRA
jgi:D-tyrosyl-tRNA(Tyr) deacylase